ncbi:hypothetical protein BDV26DRAFT_264370 [Aspergillus bertholletiae]|uniref:F-box domain-containing protein n=1 Tax=Aspergillus bertholletiae TaxID=1226010 RepID=A0A5N7B6U4_9EURO|nr:hypothetical protein BDV26DRAFT_264370 [Aspergillus bertholletiae]
MATQSAQVIAFSTVELLESILLHLDIQTLLTAQRTCRAWHATIQGSTAIQKALFFTPIDASSASTKVQNPLLMKMFPSFFEWDPSLLASVDMLQRPEKLEAYIRPEASWRRMLVQQPPILRIGVLLSSYAFAESHTFYELSTRHDGLMMEEFFETFIFNRDIISLKFDTPETVWWGATDSYAWLRMKELRGMTVETDLVVMIFGGATCTDFNGDGITEDVILRDQIRGIYQKLNIRPRLPTDETRLNEWKYSKWYD